MKPDLTPGQRDLFESPRALVPGADLCTSRHRGADTSVEAFQSPLVHTGGLCAAVAVLDVIASSFSWRTR
jgi:hypothetical protein